MSILQSTIRTITILVLCALVPACGGGGGGQTGSKPGLLQLRQASGGGAFDAGASSACTADASEPNNSTADATPLTFNTPLPLNFCDDDIDVFRLVTTAGALHVIETSALELRADTVLQVLGANDEILAENDDAGNSLASRIEFTPPAGVNSVNIVVRPFANTGEDTGYVLTARDNGAQELADLVFDDFTLSGFANTRSFEFVATILNQGNAFAAPTVAFYLSNDNRFDRNQDLFFAEAAGEQTAPDGTSELRGQLTIPTSTIGETQIFLVLDDQGLITELNESNNVDPLSAPSFFFADNIGNCHDDSLEPDDGPDAATSLLPGDNFNGRHCSDAEDWYTFSAVAGATYDLSTTALGGLADTTLQVFDASMTSLADNDDFSGLESRVSVSVVTDQQLFVRVGSFEDAIGEQRNYRLHLRENDNRADLISSVVDADESIRAGTSAEFILLIANGGRTDAPASVVSFGVFCGFRNRLEPELDFDQLLGTAPVQALAAGASVDIAVSVDLPPEANGDCFLSSFVDADNVIAEAVGDDDVFSNSGSDLPRLIAPAAAKTLNAKRGSSAAGSARISSQGLAP